MHSFPAVESLLPPPPPHLPKLGKKAEHVVLQRYFRTGEISLEKRGQKETLLNSKPPYPPKLFVLQSQHSRALREQLHLHCRKRVCSREVSLGAPAAKGRTREMFSSAGRSAALHLGRAMVNRKYPLWHKPKWLGRLNDKGINYLLREMWDRCLEKP